MLLVINHYLISQVVSLIEIHFQCIFSGSIIVVIHRIRVCNKWNHLTFKTQKENTRASNKNFLFWILLLQKASNRNFLFWILLLHIFLFGQWKKDSIIVFLLTITCQQEQKCVTLNAKCAWWACKTYSSSGFLWLMILGGFLFITSER